jgi:hypothetical protein
MRWRSVISVLAMLTITACGRAGQPSVASASPSARPIATSAPSPTPSAPPARIVDEQEWVPFARTDSVVLRLPSRRVERIGFHQSNHEGAQELTALPAAPRPVTEETRGRLTAARTAVDVVSDPDVEVRSPVSGRVKRSGGYVLYCKYHDDYAVIAPDSRPGWEVKVLHIDGVIVHAGDRVVAGVSVIAPRPAKLPFASDIDKDTAPPHWPHVHLEVVDPSIRNVPSPGSGC